MEGAAPVALLPPGRIYTASTLRGLKDPLAAEIEEPLSETFRVNSLQPQTRGLKGGSLGEGPLTDSSGDASSVGSSGCRMQKLLSAHSSAESVWGSASDLPSGGCMQMRHLGVRGRPAAGAELSAAELQRQLEAEPVETRKMIQVYMQQQAVQPQRAPFAAAAGGGDSREEAIRQAEEQAAAAAAASAEGSGRIDSCGASVSSTLVLNTKTKRLERKGEKEAALLRKRQEAQGRLEQTAEETEKICLLWEAFQRGCTDKSGWLRTSDFAWALQRDPRLFTIFGLKEQTTKETEQTAWGRWIAGLLKNRDEPIPLAPESTRKMRAMLNQIRRIESDLVCNERATHELKMTFQTFANGFAKFLGDSDPAVWGSTEPSFVEIATEKEPPYGMSLTEMLVRDSLLGISLTKTEAWQPDNMQFGSVRLLEPPGASLLQRSRDRAEQQRAAEAKFRAELLKKGDHHKLAARVRAEAERVELELLQQAAREELLERQLTEDEEQLQQRLRQVGQGGDPLEWHLRPPLKFARQQATATVAAASAAAAAAGSRLRRIANQQQQREEEEEEKLRMTDRRSSVSSMLLQSVAHHKKAAGPRDFARRIAT
ncbi:hypothetical protein Efla_001585 [Eimeria flavescens]